MDGHQPSRPHQTVPQHVTLPAGLTKAKIQEFPGSPYYVLGSTKAFMFPTKSSLMFSWSENYTLRNSSRELSSSWSFCLFMPHTCPTAPAGESYYLCYVAFHIGHIRTLFHSCCPCQEFCAPRSLLLCSPHYIQLTFTHLLRGHLLRIFTKYLKVPHLNLGGSLPCDISVPNCHTIGIIIICLFISLGCVGTDRSSFDLHIQVPNP